MVNNKKYTIFETFVGAGGSHLGFKNKGFIAKYVNDIDANFLKTLTHNNKELKKAWVDNRDILEVDPKAVLEKLNMKVGELDLLLGGIVCKGFSLAGEKSPNDTRNFFFLKQLDFVKIIQPKLSIIENVPAILGAEVIADKTPQAIREQVDKVWQDLEDFKGKKAKLRKEGKINAEIAKEGKKLRKEKTKLVELLKKNNYLESIFDLIKKRYEALGYKIYHRILNSAWYGSATKRDRAVIVAVRNNIDLEFEFPQPTHYSEEIRKPINLIENYPYQKPITIFEALKTIDYKVRDKDNKPMGHTEKTIQRFSYVRPGTNITDYLDKMPKELAISKFYSRGNTMRLDGNKCSPTLVPGHSNFPIHPIEHRQITVREAAVITGFPLKYKFFGNHTKRCEQVGNAIPIRLAEVLAQSCINLLENYYQGKENRVYSIPQMVEKKETVISS